MSAGDDRAAVVDVLLRYAEACDDRRWELFDEVFAPDVVIDYSSGTHVEGRAAAVEGVRRHLGGCGPTQHLLGNHRVSVTGDRAHSSCNVRAFHAGLGAHAEAFYELFAAYHDDLARLPEGWRIVRRRMDVRIERGDRGVLGPGPG